MDLMISISATQTKSLRGATELIAKKGVKLSDDVHVAIINKGDTFYVKKLGKRYYALDTHGKEFYQFSIDSNFYKALLDVHGDKPKSARVSSPSVGAPKKEKTRKYSSSELLDSDASNAAMQFASQLSVPKGSSPESVYGVVKLKADAPDVDTQRVKEIFAKHVDDDSSTKLSLALKEEFKRSKAPDSTNKNLIGYFAHLAGL